MELEEFKSGTKWYYITTKGTVDSFIIHSGLSPKAAHTLSKVHRVYKTWEEANEAFKEYNKMFTTFNS